MCDLQGSFGAQEEITGRFSVVLSYIKRKEHLHYVFFKNGEKTQGSHSPPIFSAD